LFTFATPDRLEQGRKGDQLPLVPNHRINGGMEFMLTPEWRLNFYGGDVRSPDLRGDGANKHRRVGAYFVANAQIMYQAKTYDIFLRLENLFDSDYESYGAFFENVLDGTGIERFLGPGAPFGAFGGVRLRF